MKYTLSDNCSMYVDPVYDGIFVSQNENNFTPCAECGEWPKQDKEDNYCHQSQKSTELT